MPRAAMADSSLQAYFEKVEPNLTELQGEVYQAVRTLGTATNKDVARHLDKYPNETSGRMTELREQGLIEKVDTCNEGDIYEVVE